MVELVPQPKPIAKAYAVGTGVGFATATGTKFVAGSSGRAVSSASAVAATSSAGVILLNDWFTGDVTPVTALVGMSGAAGAAYWLLTTSTGGRVLSSVA